MQRQRQIGEPHTVTLTFSQNALAAVPNTDLLPPAHRSISKDSRPSISQLYPTLIQPSPEFGVRSQGPRRPNGKDKCPNSRNEAFIF